MVQITDTHLGCQEGETLLGVDTDRSLASVLSLLRSERAAPDLLLVTGDVSNNGHRTAYQRLLACVQGMATRCAWLPGNHDERELMRDTGDDWLVQRIDCGPWQILLLDSSVPDQVGGSLSQPQLDALRAALVAQPQQYALVCLHHHVLPIGCDWLDEQVVDNREAFFDLITQFPQVRAVISGHVHQQSDREHRGVRVLTTPSTCVQFAPHSADFAVDTLNPGYRWLELHPDGRIDSGVSRVSGVDFKVDTQASGY